MNTQTAERPMAEAFAWFDSIREMVDALKAAESTPSGAGAPIDHDHTMDAREAAETSIQESILSVEVRSGWHCVGGDDPVPAEYRILLSTGGPAVQLAGELDEHGEPTSAHLEHQDWFKPWTEVRSIDLATSKLASGVDALSVDQRIELTEKAEATLLTFAQQFYFGEG